MVLRSILLSQLYNIPFPKWNRFAFIKQFVTCIVNMYPGYEKTLIFRVPGYQTLVGKQEVRIQRKLPWELLGSSTTQRIRMNHKEVREVALIVFINSFACKYLYPDFPSLLSLSTTRCFEPSVFTQVT